METVRHELTRGAPGTQRHWLSLHHGTRRSGRKTVIQCALHADEIPGLIVGHHLRRHLQMLEKAGAIDGEIVLVPAANPIGLAQGVLGSAIGRFELASGGNFNRGFRWLTPDLTPLLDTELGQDAADNTRRLRAKSREVLQSIQPGTELQELQLGLQTLAIDADVVLDLHSDSEALVHLYAPTPHAEKARVLARCLGASPVLLARESGDDPFDESVSRHWWELQEAAQDRVPIERACFSTTIELRGERDVAHRTADQDARGLLRFLWRQGHLQATAQQAQEWLGSDPVTGQDEPLVTGLDAVDPVVSPRAGVLVLQRRLGDQVTVGEVVAEVIDPFSGEASALRSRTTGLLFAHTDRRWVLPGQRVAKVAGQIPIRTGKLLSP